jgi:hypothetical protein
MLILGLNAFHILKDGISVVAAEEHLRRIKHWQAFRAKPSRGVQRRPVLRWQTWMPWH